MVPIVMSDLDRDPYGVAPHRVISVDLSEGEGEVIHCQCGNVFRDPGGREAWERHRE